VVSKIPIVTSPCDKVVGCENPRPHVEVMGV
jgi:hypothetical protein